MKLARFKTKKAAVEEALRLLALRGKVHWMGDLGALRRAKGR